MTESISIEALSRAEIASHNLQQILQIDFDVLLRTLVPDAEPPAMKKVGISQKMQLGSAHLLQQLGPEKLSTLGTHRSDTVRGLAVFGLASHLRDASVEETLAMVRPFAADTHFGVREWAWMAVRPRLAQDLAASIAALSAWTQDADVNIRRFAIEVLRPRGVWCKHITALRENPATALPLLEAMRTEPEKYAQDSVANWLNDTAKDQPQWVQALCQRWLEECPNNAATRRICKRAQRSIKE